jgi:hypothetical protein
VPLRGSGRRGPAGALERRASEEAEMKDRLGIQRVYPADTACSPPIRIPRQTQPPRFRRCKRVVVAKRQTYTERRPAPW